MIQITTTTTEIKNDAKRKAQIYILSVLGLSWVIGFVGLHLIEFKSLLPRVLLILCYGFLPAMLAVFFNKRAGGTWRDLQFVKPSWKSIVIALVIPAVYVILGFYLQVQLGYRSKPDWSVFGGHVQLLLSTVGGLFLTCLLVLGEEIGWRGYLQGKMFQAFGEFRGTILLGLVWGIWHLPVALTGYNFPEHPYLEAFITYPLACVAYSLIIAYFGSWKHSIWVAAVFHGANNHFNMIALSTTDLLDSWSFAWLSNAICVDLILIFGGLYWLKLKKKRSRVN